VTGDIIAAVGSGVSFGRHAGPPQSELLRHIGVPFLDGIDCSDEFGWIAALWSNSHSRLRKKLPNRTWLDIGGEDKNSQAAAIRSQRWR